MKFKSIVFDLDGTLADTIPITVYAIKETVKRITGKELSDQDILKEFGPVDTEIVKKLIGNGKGLQGEKLYVEIFEEKFHDFVKPIEGINELMEYIKDEGIKTGVFTGRGERVARIILEKLNLVSNFDVIVAGDHTQKPKPDPEGIMIALDKLGCETSDSAYVGDFDVDIEASRAAGVTSILALWSSTGSEELINLNPDKHFRKVSEFIDWLREK